MLSASRNRLPRYVGERLSAEQAEPHHSRKKMGSGRELGAGPFPAQSHLPHHFWLLQQPRVLSSLSPFVASFLV